MDNELAEMVGRNGSAPASLALPLGVGGEEGMIMNLCEREEGERIRRVCSSPLSAPLSEIWLSRKLCDVCLPICARVGLGVVVVVVVVRSFAAVTVAVLLLLDLFVAELILICFLALEEVLGCSAAVASMLIMWLLF